MRLNNCLSQLWQHKNNAGLLNLLGLVYHKQARFPEAMKQFRAALTANPSYLEASLNLISTLCDLSRYDEAREEYAKLGATMVHQLKLPQFVMGRWQINMPKTPGHMPKLVCQSRRSKSIRKLSVYFPI